MVKLHQQSQSILTGHLFKKFYGGFEPNILIWLPYDDEDNDLTLPFSFRFETGCSDPEATSILNCIIKHCALLAEFRHGRGKTSSSSHLGNLSTYEFYHPNFVARQFGLVQLYPRLFFSNILKPKEGISEPLEALKVFQLGSELSSYHLVDWTRVTFTSESFDGWWQKWHSHLFCEAAHNKCVM